MQQFIASWITQNLIDSCQANLPKQFAANMECISRCDTDVVIDIQPHLSRMCKTSFLLPGHVAQSVTYLATDASLTADPWVASFIPARSYTLVEIDHEIISTVILLPSAESFKSFKKVCWQLQAKVCSQSTD